MSTRAAEYVCPGCGLRTPLEVAVQHEAARVLIVDALESHGDYGRAMLGYIGLHRPRKHALTWDKLARLVGELLAMRQAGEIIRDGVRHAVDDALWVAAFAAVRDAAGKTLTLPLDGHGYLLSVLASMAQRERARAEAQAMSRARGETPIGYSAAHPVPVSAPVARSEQAEEAPAVPPPPEVLEALRKFSARSRRPLTDADRNPRQNRERERPATMARIEGKPVPVEIISSEKKRGRVRHVVRRLDVDPDIAAANTLVIAQEDLL